MRVFYPLFVCYFLKDYPDYYQVISEPVCLSQIENNVRDNKVVAVSPFVQHCA